MKTRIAVLDLNNGYFNQGMRCIKSIVKEWSEKNNYDVIQHDFDVRQKNEIPDLTYDIYISSGGPGSPLESEGEEWDKKYCEWIKAVQSWNETMDNYPKKHAFFICHSFQLACRYYKIGHVSQRKSTSFGVFPMTMMPAAKDEIVFQGLLNPFYAVDSRDFQVTKPNHEKLREMGATILAIEKKRLHVPHERAVMAVRFNDYFIGTQFHPEADASGMSLHLQTEEKKKAVIAHHGYEKWKSMLEQLNDPEKIVYTHDHILPNFLNNAIGELVEA